MCDAPLLSLNCDKPLEDCENLLEFLGSSQVADSTNDTNYCDSLINACSNSVSRCKYFDLIPKFETKNNCSLFLLHVNIRSLQKNFDKLFETLNEFLPKPDVICLSESRIKTSPLVNINIPGYEFVFSSPRVNSGGVGVYISTQLNFYNVQQNWIGFEHCEDIWLSVEDRRSNQYFNIIVLYRHPNTSIPEFISKLDDAFCNPLLTNRCTYVLGDITIDIINSNRSKAAQEYVNVWSCKGFYPIITKPTRVAETSATIIDHIILLMIYHAGYSL